MSREYRRRHGIAEALHLIDITAQAGVCRLDLDRSDPLPEQSVPLTRRAG